MYYQQIVSVNGEQGARSYQMMPNSSALLMDQNEPIVWLCITDGGGYKTVKPYKIEEIKPPEPPDFNKLMERLARIEERLYESDNAGIKQGQ